MTLKERIQAYCQYKGISVSQFERQAGLSNGYFKEGSKMPRPDRISKILNKFPDINRNWLLYEEEPMLKTTDQPVSQGGEDVTPPKTELNNPKTMERFLDSLLRQNEELMRQVIIIELPCLQKSRNDRGYCFNKNKKSVKKPRSPRVLKKNIAYVNLKKSYGKN